VSLQLASTFTDALTKLTKQEAGAASLVAIRLQTDPKGNGLQMHRIEAAPGFWSVRVSQDIRIVLHKEGESTLLAYVDHHDAAYRWAERKRLVRHERTGAMQFVEVPVRSSPAFAGEGDHPKGGGGADATGVGFTAAGPSTAPDQVRGGPPPRQVGEELYPFATLTDDQMLDVGVPRDWLQPVRETAEDDLFDLLERLPQEAAEALLTHATGGRIEDHVAVRTAPEADPYAHPDAQRRFRTVDNLEELKAALDQPFAKWAVFLHPAQRALAERDWTGPARVTGSAGTGKTIVALHRAVAIVRTQPDARVLLTTFSKPLAAALSAKLAILTEAEPGLAERIEVRALDQAASKLCARLWGQPNMATDSMARAAIADAQKLGLGAGLTAQFLWKEWDELVDAWNVTDADAYAAIPRIGRRVRLGPAQREAAWGVFELVRRRLGDRGVITWPALYQRLQTWLEGGGKLPFSHVIVDEAQDLTVSQVRFLGAVARTRPDALFLAGDIGQRIFRLPFSWAKLGLDLRGRSHRLRVNYRTSHQIRTSADRLLPRVIVDMDGEEEGRATISVFDGPVPEINLFPDDAAERKAAASWLRDRLGEGMDPAEIGVLVRSQGQLGQARETVKLAGLDWRSETGPAVLPMHDAKGLEFRAVAILAANEDVIPDPGRLAGIGDMAELEAAHETERHLLYVACTRARDRLWISGVEPGSEFLEDLA
jgi:hypothetical protein